MHEIVDNVCQALDELSAHVMNSWRDDRTVKEVHGWHHPTLTKHDLAHIPAELASRLREADPDTLDPDLEELLDDVPRRLQLLHGDTVPYMFNGHGHQAIPAYIGTLQWLECAVSPLLGWQTLSDNKALPAALVRRLRSIQAEVNALVPKKEALEGQIQLIKEATEAAESLPTDLQALKEARDTIKRLSEESAETFGKIDERSKKAADFIGHITEQSEAADKLVEQCEEAYRITTTKGLAAAFDQRARRLSTSMWVWVGGLVLSLGVGAYFGLHRVEILSTAIFSEDPRWGVVWMQILLSALTVGAPLWFAWLATKQIGQRFRLAEDYGFKASVAKAYEGYRREAARIDEAFEARLFSSALSRLEEAPLRLVEESSHGSPWHELIASAPFQRALQTVPELKEKFVDIATRRRASSQSAVATRDAVAQESTTGLAND